MPRVALDKSDAFKGFKDAAWRAVDEALDVAAEDALSHRTIKAGAAKSAEDTGGKVGTIVDLAVQAQPAHLESLREQAVAHARAQIGAKAAGSDTTTQYDCGDESENG